MSSTTSSNNPSSFTGVLAGINRKLSHGKPAAMEIQLDNHYSSKAYTSSSSLSGHVVISPAKDTRFDSLQILLMGVSRTRVDGVHVPHATQHTFLKLTMPIPDSSYPVPRLYEAGRTYTVPFNFVIPDHLTLSACSHKTASDAVRAHHLCLPPSLGTWDRDDMTPDMARVEYAVRARLFREEVSEKTRTKLLDASRLVHVLPSFAELPPLSITPADSLYCMAKTKSVRRSILSPKTGRVTLTAAQPGAIMLSADGSAATTTSARIDLRYEAASSSSSSGQSPPSSLPRITEVTSKVSAVTFFGGNSINDFPDMGNWVRTYGAQGRGSFTYNTSLGSTAVGAGDLEWQQEKSAQAIARRDSGYCSDAAADSDHPSATGSSGGRRWSAVSSSSTSSSAKTTKPAPVYHTASLQVPISLPTHKKTFAPTFHSCVVSRVYVLWLTISLSSCGGTTSKATLGVPLQVGVDSDTSVSADAEGERPPSFEAAMEAAEAEEHLRPRRTFRAPEEGGFGGMRCRGMGMVGGGGR
ncbi:arrestin [Apiospora marii]|uniref:Arrestin n=1 Tax=Apiospora marii TaxID=335849 RepID=A0ABR1SBE7_9PEZI